jgi:hypothetical protein
VEEEGAWVGEGDNFFKKEVFMPRGDGTGPMGQGSMTGRGMGYCAGYANPGFASGNGFGFYGSRQGGRAFGCGFGRGFGGGRGRGLGFYNRPRFVNTAYEYPQTNQDQEKKHLQEDINALESELSEMKKYLSEMEKDNKK